MLVGSWMDKPGNTVLWTCSHSLLVSTSKEASLPQKISLTDSATKGDAHSLRSHIGHLTNLLNGKGHLDPHMPYLVR
jgi:hypothetical protein